MYTTEFQQTNKQKHLSSYRRSMFTVNIIYSQYITQHVHSVYPIYDIYQLLHIPAPRCRHQGSSIAKVYKPTCQSTFCSPSRRSRTFFWRVTLERIRSFLVQNSFENRLYTFIWWHWIKWRCLASNEMQILNGKRKEKCNLAHLTWQLLQRNGQ
jgi:hypothetical protein